MKSVILIMFFLVFLSGLYSQTISINPDFFFQDMSMQSGNEQTRNVLDLDEEPEKSEEFPLWLRKLNRFEIIFIGSFPLSWFYSSVGWDISRWIGSNFDWTYAPWPFKNESSYRPTVYEIRTTLLTACALSLGVALTDLIITTISELD